MSLTETVMMMEMMTVVEVVVASKKVMGSVMIGATRMLAALKLAMVMATDEAFGGCGHVVMIGASGTVAALI